MKKNPSTAFRSGTVHDERNIVVLEKNTNIQKEAGWKGTNIVNIEKNCAK